MPAVCAAGELSGVAGERLARWRYGRSSVGRRIEASMVRSTVRRDAMSVSNLPYSSSLLGNEAIAVAPGMMNRRCCRAWRNVTMLPVHLLAAAAAAQGRAERRRGDEGRR
ncbi:hypothetical protein P4133_05075 [Pseudomonas aeruginosa]|nr:hypothetical protein [Pseudomonas aeruginosa]